MTPSRSAVWSARSQRFASASVRAFHAYASWLVGIRWRRFIVLSLLLMLGTAILQSLPPFSWRWSYTVAVPLDDSVPQPPTPPIPPDLSQKRQAQMDKLKKLEKLRDLPIRVEIDDKGVRILHVPKASAEAASAPSAASAASAPASAAAATSSRPLIDIHLPPGTDSHEVRQALDEARQAIDEAVREAHDSAAELERTNAEIQRELADAQRDAAQALRDGVGVRIDRGTSTPRKRVREVSLGEFLPPLAMLWIVASLIIKITYRRQIAAEAQAAQAVETAEAESLKRQVVEARMAAMQAQVEPHFLFNTLASIDHLIEVDPPRASQMQKNLIALLRASMPTMREASREGVRDLGRELAVIRPYLEILKVRMEERLATDIDVPDGLLSAEFPPMMVQTLVENAVKHGLEPKPEGGTLHVKAEIVHGKLAVTVADTGLGFGRAATAGTGVGLANIRERLQLLYGPKAALTITENPGGGTRVSITVPYKPVPGADS
jgi:signal transduction histidine kinase